MSKKCRSGTTYQIGMFGPCHFLIRRPCGSLVELWSKASEIFRDRRNVFFSVYKLVGSERLR